MSQLLTDNNHLINDFFGVLEKKFTMEDKPSAVNVSPRLKQIISQLLQLEFECNEKNEKNSILLNQQLISKTMEIRAVQIQYEKALGDVGREKSTSKELQALLDEKTQQFSVMSAHLLKVEKELEFHKKNSEVLKEKVNTLTYQINSINKKQHQGEELPGCNRSTTTNTSTNLVSATHDTSMDGRHKQILNSNQPQLISSKGESFFSAACETQSSTMEVSDHNKQLQTNSECLSMDHALGKIANFSSAIFTDNFIAQELRDSLISSVPPLLPTSNFTVSSSNSGSGFLSVEFGSSPTGSGRSSGLVQKTIQRQSNMYQSPTAGSPDGKSVDTGNTTKSPSTDLSEDLSRDFQSFFSTPQNTGIRGESNSLHGFGSMSPFAGLFGSSDSTSHGREDETASASRLTVSVSPVPLNLSGSGIPSPSEPHDHQQSLDSSSHSSDMNGPGNGRRVLYHSSSHHANPSSTARQQQQQGVFAHSGNRNNGPNSSHSTSFNGGEHHHHHQHPHVFPSSNSYSPNNNAHMNHNGGGTDFNKRPCMFHLSEIWGLYGLDGNKLACKYRNRCFDMHKPLLMRKGYKKADVAVYIDKFNLVNKADAHRCLREDDDFPDGTAPAGDSSAPSPVNGSGSPGQAGGYTGFGTIAADPKKGFRCCVPNLVHIWGLKYPDGNIISDCHSPNGQCQHMHKAELMKQGMYTRSNIVGALHIYYAKNKDRLPDVLRALDADIDIQPEHYSLSAMA